MVFAVAMFGDRFLSSRPCCWVTAPAGRRWRRFCWTASATTWPSASRIHLNPRIDPSLFLGWGYTYIYIYIHIYSASLLGCLGVKLATRLPMVQHAHSSIRAKGSDFLRHDPLLPWPRRRKDPTDRARCRSSEAWQVPR